MFIESNDKDAYCAHENARNARNARNVENINAFMNMSQLKVTQIWNMRLNEYSRYWSLKALKSVTVTLYKLQMYKIIKKVKDKDYNKDESTIMKMKYVIDDLLRTCLNQSEFRFNSNQFD